MWDYNKQFHENILLQCVIATYYIMLDLFPKCIGTN